MADKELQEEEPMLFGSLAVVYEFLQRLTRIETNQTRFEATQKAHDEAIRRMQERVRRLIDKDARNA